jgi:hypothetical protein
MPQFFGSAGGFWAAAAAAPARANNVTKTVIFMAPS